ncbi:MAG: rhodanese-related sulfurtransferase [Francisellaceae bacterium]|jgi:UPF0176 protein|nr:rhodanese-related sulfurtransferase [Francisellaceae bacterium]MBT6539208.1 rhodanese-related sulfurtransferase [Francisellaceae bacterium]
MSETENNFIIVAALYHFADIPEFHKLQNPLLKLCKDNDIKGTLLLASEGINGTVSGTRADIDTLISWLHQNDAFKNLVHKESKTMAHPFIRMKVKLKKEIVTLAVDGLNPAKKTGEYVEPQDWNDLISDPDVLVVDTRNDYETNIGTFKNAMLPNTKTFREFPQYVTNNLNHAKKKRVAMFCTGGIRCEKSTAYLLQQGFENVYHLKGGILKYLEEIDNKNSLWQGECFVFDERVAVDGNLKPGKYAQCHGCRNPITAEDIQSTQYIKGICCPNCINELSNSQKIRFSERQKQIDLARKNNSKHMGADISLLKHVKLEKKQASNDNKNII